MLDAAKAFDKLWRAGLFYKLMNKMEPVFWRILYRYYLESFIIICVDEIKSLPVLTTEGIKQGGILSPFLFNFFIDDLLSGCRSLDIGALVGVTNTSILAYCLLMIFCFSRQMNLTCSAFLTIVSPTQGHGRWNLMPQNLLPIVLEKLVQVIST